MLIVLCFHKVSYLIYWTINQEVFVIILKVVGIKSIIKIYWQPQNLLDLLASIYLIDKENRLVILKFIEFSSQLVLFD